MNHPTKSDNFAKIVHDVYIPKLRKIFSFGAHVYTPAPLGMQIGVEKN